MQTKTIMIIVLGAALVGVAYYSTLDFYVFYSCTELENYMMGDATGVIQHDELTERQHMELHKMYEVRMC